MGIFGYFYRVVVSLALCAIHPCALAVCISGAQCEASDGLITSASTGDSFVPAGTGKTSAALAATVGSTIQGTDLTITAAANNTYAGYAGTGGTLDLINPTINGWGGLHAEGSGSKIMMDQGAVTTIDAAFFLEENTSATLSDVHIATTGNTATAITLKNGAHFSMAGGSLTATTALGGINIEGSNTVLDLTGVSVTTSGNRGVVNQNASSINNVMNLRNSVITHQSNNLHGAVAALGSGQLLIDASTVKAVGVGVAVLLHNSDSSTPTSQLIARNHFDFSTVAANAHGLQISGNATTSLQDGKITTSGAGSYGIWLSSGVTATPLTAERVTVETFGAQAHGIYLGFGLSTLTDVDITVNSLAFGLVSVGASTEARMTRGRVNAVGTNAIAALAANGGRLELDNVSLDALNNTTGGTGVRAQSGSSAVLKNNTTVTTDGAAAPGLVFLGATATNVITVDNSGVTARDSFAVLANGGTDTLNAANGALIRGDRLVWAGDCPAASCGNVFGSRLTLNADNSQFIGHADVSSLSRLSMSLASNSVWTLLPSAGGLVQSNISLLDFKNSHIVFDPSGSALYQTLRVGAGNTGGNPAVYHGGNSASITLNTLLNTGGVWLNQHTDRVLIEGDVSGTTLLHINEVAGSPGGLTSSSGANLASEGISVVQASGTASEKSFALAGGYVTMGSLPYRYTLHAYGPGSSNGSADVNQQQVGGLAHWDWRLQSALAPASSGTGSALTPQAYSYLAAPSALFQAGLTDIGTLHRRLGEARSDGAQANATSGQRSFFLRSYGGAQDYRAGRHSSPYVQDAKVRYAALQLGGNLWGRDTPQYSVRLGLAGNRGALSFAPRHVAGSRKTHMSVWAVSPTLTWQHASGAYVDALASRGAFHGKVSTSLRGKTATLKGRSSAASVETGIPLNLNAFTVTPQVQLIYQRLSLDHTRDVDNFPVELGSLKQWTLRTGAEIKMRSGRSATANSAFTLRGSVHLVQALHSRQQIYLGEDFDVGKSGTTLDASLGVDATFAKGKALLYGELTRQQRISRAGHQGWTASFGLRLGF